MTTKPINLKPHEVRGILDGRQTQLRRRLEPQPQSGAVPGIWPSPVKPVKNDYYWPTSRSSGVVSNRPHPPEKYLEAYPLPYAIGDTLWGREKWSGEHHWLETKPKDRTTFVANSEIFIHDHIWYWVDGEPDYGDWERPRSSMHMPRWASRITLTVTDLRIQRVKDISEADAFASGVDPEGYETGAFDVNGEPIEDGSYCLAFCNQYETDNSPGSFETDWVAVYTIERMEG